MKKYDATPKHLLLRTWLGMAALPRIWGSHPRHPDQLTPKMGRMMGVPGGRAGPTGTPIGPGKAGAADGRRKKIHPERRGEEQEQGAGAADSVSLSPDRDASKKAR